ncbi:MAG: acetolactate decarboxylase [Candidatus Hydrothermarchaeales archaeon]
MGEILAINTIEDLLKGDLWEYITLGEVKETIGKRDCFGLGTTTKETNGEVIFFTRDDATKFYWIDPESFGAKEIMDDKERFPFIAIFFPTTERYDFNIEGDVEEGILECIEETSFKDAALFLDGDFSDVRLSVAAHLPKRGIESDLSFKTHERKEKSRWMAAGVYTENYLDALSYHGRKVHLHAIDEDDMVGGHLLSARCEDAKLSVYPIEKVDCLHSDLTVHSGRVVDDSLVFIAENLGFSNTENVKVSVRVDGREHLEVISLKRRESREMVVELEGRPGRIEVIIDPDNYILESDESNNRFELNL